jgi:mRNA-degrading endonuclease RelE of RelBE toxin-antitoxin system
MERFQRDLAVLSKEDRVRCLELALALPRVMGEPHRHLGLGLRKVHHSGVYEARVGLGLRVVFAFRDEQAILVTVGSHDDVRRYLASL